MSLWVNDTGIKHRHPPLESMAVDVVVLKHVRQYVESEKNQPIAYGLGFRISVPRQHLTAGSTGVPRQQLTAGSTGVPR